VTGSEAHLRRIGYCLWEPAEGKPGIHPLLQIFRKKKIRERQKMCQILIPGILSIFYSFIGNTLGRSVKITLNDLKINLWLPPQPPEKKFWKCPRYSQTFRNFLLQRWKFRDINLTFSVPSDLVRPMLRVTARKKKLFQTNFFTPADQERSRTYLWSIHLLLGPRYRSRYELDNRGVGVRLPVGSRIFSSR
jgi:hypothetical protein